MEHKHLQSSHETEKEDVRLTATKTIWAMSVAMLGISIPLSAITNSALIPLVVLGAAAFGTSAVWIFGGKGQSLLLKNLATRQQLSEMEERLANLETITNFEQKLAAKESLKHLSSESVEQSAETTYGTTYGTTRVVE